MLTVCMVSMAVLGAFFMLSVNLQEKIRKEKKNTLIEWKREYLREGGGGYMPGVGRIKYDRGTRTGALL